MHSDKIFLLTPDTEITLKTNASGVEYARQWLHRDLKAVIRSPEIAAVHSRIVVELTGAGAPEAWTVTFPVPGTLLISASDELGAIYALLDISSRWLKIDPFWFWHENLKPCNAVEIPRESYCSAPSRIRYRGWFINDEVLLEGWTCPDKWERALETLLRCGGNVVIPGTDINSQRNRALALRVGLQITHHHAEPLGAEMFCRVWPDTKMEWPEGQHLFEKIWADAIETQKDKKIIWTLGFRGQGDRPFWEDDPRYADEAGRGKVISEIIALQFEMVKSAIPDAVCCTNLYGEVLELYQKGLITIPEPVIRIWADNGFGKMVSRRQWNHNPRLYSLPAETDSGCHGIYYHVAFYDLQASNHLTPLPNSVEFMADELCQILNHQADKLFIVNTGNIRMHTRYLDLLRQWWLTGQTNFADLTDQFISRVVTPDVELVKPLFQRYADCHVKFGSHNDEHAGEQIYHYTVRNILTAWMKNETSEPLSLLYWLTGEQPLPEQVRYIRKMCEEPAAKWDSLLAACEEAMLSLSTEKEKEEFYNNLVLFVRIHQSGCQGTVLFCRAFEAYRQKDYVSSYVFIHRALCAFRKGLAAMSISEKGKWETFFSNDCLTNVQLTVECLEALRSYIRITREEEPFYGWQKRYLMPQSEGIVALLTNFHKHLSDELLAEKLEGVINTAG
ncbi:glycosyl hydrolase 115 family protein [Dryocola sp. BD613]|uniref:glycosyl hydrolase 115 family protein n=1 Tax=Dryocola sp. BD613 TaxID=3133272 RepID=UPI003F4F8454